MGESIKTVKLTTWADGAAAKASLRKQSSQTIQRSRSRGQIDGIQFSECADLPQLNHISFRA